LRALIRDVIDVYEVNRKECAKLLLDIPRWLPSGTFKPKTAPGQGDMEVDKSTESTWVLENLIVEVCLLAAMFLRASY
jgi:nuclear cap-binding protein subunit 1